MSRNKQMEQEPKVKSNVGATPTRSKKLGNSNSLQPTEPDRTITLNAFLFPPVPNEWRPRELVFDCLSTDDIAMLESRGYQPLLLRWLPRRTEKESLQWLARLMQGVVEGTVAMPRERAVALELELKTKKVLFEKGPSIIPDEKPVARNALENLEWAGSRHAFTGNTTMVAPEVVAEFVRKAAEGETDAKDKKPKKR